MDKPSVISPKPPSGKSSEKELKPEQKIFKQRHQDWKEGKNKRIVNHLSMIENPQYNKEIVLYEGVISSSSLSYYTPKTATGTYRDKDTGSLIETNKTILPNSYENVKFVAVTEARVHTRLAQLMHIPPRSSNIEINTYRLTYRVRVRPPVRTLTKDGDKVLDEKGYEYKSYDVYIVTDEPIYLQASQTVLLHGESLPDPKTQKTTLLVTQIEFPDHVTSYDPEKLRTLYMGFQSFSVKQRVDWVLNEFEKYSKIVGRKNIAYTTLLSYFSPTWVQFNRDTQRGWLLSLIIGDTTCGKSAIVNKAIQLLKCGTLITAETASAVGLTGTATQADRGEWFVDWGLLPLNNERLLAIDGAQKLSSSQWATIAEAERIGVVTKATAAKGSAPARTKQIKIANPVDHETKGYKTKPISDFLRPCQAIPTILDGTSIARLDLAVIVDKRTVDTSQINKYIKEEHDSDLELIAESVRWAWGKSAKVTFTEEAIQHILDEATRLTRKYYSKHVPLVDHNFKWKLARLSVALAQLVLSTDPEFKTVTVTKEHADEIIRFIEYEYTASGLAAQAKAEEFARLDVSEAPEIIEDIEYSMGKGVDEAIRICKWITDTGGATKEQIKVEFELADNNVLRPTIAVLRNHNLVNQSRGFTPSQKLIQLYKFLEENEDLIRLEVGVLISDRVKRDKGDKKQEVLS